MERSSEKQIDAGATARQVMADRQKKTRSLAKQKVLDAVEAANSGEFDALDSAQVDSWLDQLHHGNGNGKIEDN